MKNGINYVHKKVHIVLEDTVLGACLIKLSMTAKAGVLVIVGHFHPNLIFASKTGAYPSGDLLRGPL